MANLYGVILGMAVVTYVQVERDSDKLTDASSPRVPIAGPVDTRARCVPPCTRARTTYTDRNKHLVMQTFARSPSSPSTHVLSLTYLISMVESFPRVLVFSLSSLCPALFFVLPCLTLNNKTGIRKTESAHMALLGWWCLSLQ